MSARFKRTRSHQAHPVHQSLKAESCRRETSLQLSLAVDKVRTALNECLSALRAIEVTLHSLKLQDIAPSELEILKQVIHAVSSAQEFLAVTLMRYLATGLQSDRGAGDAAR